MNKTRVLFENMVSLFALQVVNYILPLFTFPYITRVLGPERFGLLAFAGAFIQYFITLVDYGFNLSATRQISLARDKPLLISTIVASVYIIKTILAVISFIFIVILIRYVPKFQSDSTIYYIYFIAVIGNVLFPVWYYQGMERIKFMSMLNVASKLLSTVCIFLFVKQRSDYLMVALISTLGVIVPGLISMIALFTWEKITLKLPTFYEFKNSISSGWPIFVSLLSATVLGNTCVLLLGLLTSNLIVGYYSIAQKVIWALISLITPISNSIYPRVSSLLQNSFNQGMVLLRKTLLYGSIAFGLISVGLFFCAGMIVQLVMGYCEINVILLIRIMAILPFLLFVDNIFGTQIMLNIGMERTFMKIYVYAVMLLVGLSFLLISWQFLVGAAIAQVLVEIFILSMMYASVRKQGVHLIRIEQQ